jgi:hypothetical protein
MTTYLVVVGLIFALMFFGIGVERLYRRFAARHPQLGPYRKSDGCSCCKSSASCGEKACDRG